MFNDMASIDLSGVDMSVFVQRFVHATIARHLGVAVSSVVERYMLTSVEAMMTLLRTSKPAATCSSYHWARRITV